MKSYAYHEAGHTIVARYVGFPVEYTTIDEKTSPLEATKTVKLKDYFDEDALMFGQLKVKGKKTLSQDDYKVFNSILLFKLAGYVAVDISGFDTGEVKHYEEDRAFAFNILNHLEKDKAGEKYDKMRRIAENILRRRWEEVESLANRLMEEKTVYFNSIS